MCCGTGLMAAELIPPRHRSSSASTRPPRCSPAPARCSAPTCDSRQAVLPDLPVDEVFDAAMSTFDGLNYLTLADLQAHRARDP